MADRSRRIRAEEQKTPITRWISEKTFSSSRTLAAELWHLRFDKEISTTKALAPHQVKKEWVRIRKLNRVLEKLEEERERRRRTEAINAKLIDRLLEAELSGDRLFQRFLEERRGREVAEKACGELIRRIGERKAETERLRRDRADMEEDRRMMQVAEAWREERVHMKLSDANLALSYAFSKINFVLSELQSLLNCPNSDNLTVAQNLLCVATESLNISNDYPGSEDFYKSNSDENNDISFERRHNVSPVSIIGREKKSPTKQLRNPHIARGMKGCIEWTMVGSAPKSKTALKAKISKEIILEPKLRLRRVLKS